MDDVEQLTLFRDLVADETNDDEKSVDVSVEVDYERVVEEIIPYEVEDRISVQFPKTEEEDSLSYHYLKEFEGKRGVVKKVILLPRLQYEILFGERQAILYHEEITI